MIANSNLYRIHPSSSFTDVLAEFIINNFSNQMHSLQVIVPNGINAVALKNKIVEKKSVTILPNILPVSSISLENEITDIKNKLAISTLEELTILAEIIYNYNNLSFTMEQALDFAAELANLFYDFTINQIDISKLNNFFAFEQAKHWQTISSFLQYAYTEWNNVLHAKQKIDRATYQQRSLNSLLTTLKNKENNIICAGIFGYNKALWKFFKQLALLPNGYIILPPIALNDQQINAIENNHDSPLYFLKQLLFYLNKNLSDFSYIKYVDENNDINFNQLFAKGYNTQNNATFDSTNISYYEHPDVFNEAKNIAKLCQDNADKTIAIIVNDDKTKNIYCTLLAQYNITYQDLTYYSFANLSQVNIFLLLSDFLCNDFDIKKLFLLLKNPLIYCSQIITIESYIAGKNRFINNWQDLDNLLASSILEDKTDLLPWYNALTTILKTPINNDSFTNIFHHIINILEKLYPSVWTNTQGLLAYEFFSEIAELNWQLPLVSLTNFPNIFKSLANASKYSLAGNNSNISLLNITNACLLKYDLVIITNSNEGILPPVIKPNPWFSRQMQKDLGIYCNMQHSELLYQLYLTLYNKQIIITRAIKHDGNNCYTASSYLQKLELVTVISKAYIHKISYSNNNLSKTEYTVSSFFPHKISITDIETLLRNPYGFYAKNILKLRKIENLSVAPQLSEFGSFVHKVFEQYTKLNCSSLSKKILIEHILNIRDEILNSIILPPATKKNWREKIEIISDEFVDFDLKIREQTVKIYSEIKGNLNIKLPNDKIITITGIADRLQISEEGIVTIFDYKTGGVPTNTDINNGLSPQLIILALMCLEKGFNIDYDLVASNSTPILSYIKIASTKPYISYTEHQFSLEKINEHYLGLRNLLQHYTTHLIFPMEAKLAKHNDYAALMRNVNFLDNRR